MASILRRSSRVATSGRLERLLFPFCALHSGSEAFSLLKSDGGLENTGSISRRSSRATFSCGGVGFRNRTGDFWCSSRGVDRRYFGASSTGKSETDGEAIASQMISYAASCRKNETAQVEVLRVLEQGLNFLHSQGPAAVNAAGRVMLTLATLQLDGGKLSDALDVLQLTANLQDASVEVRVAATEALIAVLLRMHKDSDALAEAHKLLKLVEDADGLSVAASQELGFRAAATVQFVEHVIKFKYTGDILDMSGLSSWVNDKEAQVDGVAAAVLGLAECAHSRAQLSQAKDLYEKASALSESNLSKPTLGMSAGAMSSQEVLAGALAGLGQVALHSGDFDEAEAKLTMALNYAEQISGDKHRRVGVVLACLADVYARRGKARGTGDLTLTEGLYRKATELLEAPLPDDPASGKDLDLADVTSLARARYGAFLSHMKKRESEASKLQAWAAATWKGPRSLTDVLELESPSKTVGSVKVDDSTDIGGCVVIDVRLGRVL
ncbi:hypothetical protein MPTK1_1g27260 [Marchantia polymorpha subsp. ruderalis]|uniref:MalT-like TPR region domain-containing protein n=2 Tax=Marchantia polymorpha TaxID=3197 RepID=A0AAF6AUT6_MARPO|nr:hypothetical protein MARPO_0002s0152 [Marchantia polymorpha]BBN00207.1 hypothetical protein Mp_1g27260 [Marchantia polymorpha subsp. ruderalis]|eukprot:PTQ49677.1 hypothetical protein MARPO_0002s0152 [Marchantia polymorpha]